MGIIGQQLEKWLGPNWRTTTIGVVHYLMAVPGVADALYDLASGKPVNWKYVAVSVVLAVAGTGHVLAQDAGAPKNNGPTRIG
jgi:hypothetical protein